MDSALKLQALMQSKVMLMDENINLTEKYGTDLDEKWEREAAYYAQFPTHHYKVFKQGVEVTYRRCSSTQELKDEMWKIKNVYGFKASILFAIFDCETKTMHTFGELYEKLWEAKDDDKTKQA